MSTDPPWTLLAPDDTPLGVPLLDLRRLALAARSTPQGEAAHTFAARREAPPRDAGLTPPDRAITPPRRLTYPTPPSMPEGWLFQARRPEEKWDLRLQDGALWCHRSWTGTVALHARVWHTARGELQLSHLRVHPEFADADPVAQLDFLVWSHLFGRPVPHPLPPGGLDHPQQAAAWSFGRFGALGWWGAEADLTDALRHTVDDPPPSADGPAAPG